MQPKLLLGSILRSDAFRLWTACSLVTPIGAVPPLKPDPNIVRGREQNNVNRNRLASKQHLIEDYGRHLGLYCEPN